LLRRTQQDLPEPGSAPSGVERRTGGRRSTDHETAEDIDSAPSGIERRKHERVAYDIPNPKKGHPQYEGVERRKADRRSVDAMRAELQRNGVPENQQSALGTMLSRTPGRSTLKPARLALILVAVVSGGMAAFFATQQNNEPVVVAPVAEVTIVKENKIQVLVAKRAIGVGERLSINTLSWEEWPEGSIRSDYITIEDMPKAMSEMGGALARFEIFPGEPIREQKLARASQGYLSAILKPGMRGVSVPISPESASGGFINPNDQVDVILTQASPTGIASETILQNVKVLAIDARLGERGETGAPPEPLENNGAQGDNAQIFSNDVIVTLALNTSEAEVIIGAIGLGELSLVLRSMEDFGAANNLKTTGSNQAIRLSSPFWTNNGGTPSLQ